MFRRTVDDFQLSRFACYLIAQARRQELND